MTISETHLTAACVSCGASIALSLESIADPCNHCDHQSPLPTETRESLDRLRARLGASDKATRQLTASSLLKGDNLHGVGYITIIVCWLFFGGIGLYVCLDHEVPLLEFLLQGQPASQWWLLWSIALGLPLSIGLLETSVASVRALTFKALPVPPLSQGSLARCRCCGAELPPAGVLRRCWHCHSDNLVITGRYLAAQNNAERAVAEMAAAMEQNLASRIDAGGTLAMVGGLLPFALLFIGPALGLVLPGQALYWVMPLAAMLFAIVAAVIAARLRLPVESLELMTLGQRVCIEPENRRRVCAQLIKDCGSIHLLGHKLKLADFAIETHRTEGRLEVTVYDVTPLATELAPTDRPRLTASEIWERTKDGPPLIRPVWFLNTTTGWAIYEGEEFEPLLCAKRRSEPPHTFCY